MQKITLSLTIFFALALLTLSCDRPECLSDHPIFTKHHPNSKIYKDELLAQLKNRDQSELTYWLQKYDVHNGQEYLYFDVQGEGLCATLALRMQKWDELEQLRDKRGVSYRGAEFTNLVFDIEQYPLATHFVYQSHDRIID